MISFPKSRAGEGFVTAPECRITMVKGLISTCEEVNVLKVFRQDFLHVGSVEITNNNKGCLWVHISRLLIISYSSSRAVALPTWGGM